MGLSVYAGEPKLYTKVLCIMIIRFYNVKLYKYYAVIILYDVNMHGSSDQVQMLTCFWKILISITPSQMLLCVAA